MNSALNTDLYQLTMAQARFLMDESEPTACFELTFRSNPFKGGYAVCAGLEQAIEFLQDFGFSADDVEYLGELKAADGSELFQPAFLDHLSTLKFTCDVDAIPEGTIVFPDTPLIRVIGPVTQCQLVETPLLNIINFQTLIATKASRCVLAADGDRVLEFGLRRAQGPDGGLSASRAAYIGGVNATSNTLAGKTYGIPVAGTHAHSWVMGFDDELEAFRAYVDTSANNAVLLVDTYDTLQGVSNAITVAGEMRERGQKLAGIRIDSGDLAWLSQQARKMLDEAGFPEVAIVASNALCEDTVASLKEQGACVNTWGIGTSMVTGGTQGALEGVYKMTAIQRPDGSWRGCMKLSDQTSKTTLPGVHQVRRYFNEDGNPIGDMVYEIDLAGEFCTMVDPADTTRQKTFSADLKSIDLLMPVFRGGEVVVDLPSLEVTCQNTLDCLASLDDSHKRFLRPHTYAVGIEQSLHTKRLDMIQILRGQK